MRTGRAMNLSSWVNAVLGRQADADRRSIALDAFLAEHEAERGAFSEAELDATRRRFRARAIVVRGPASR